MNRRGIYWIIGIIAVLVLGVGVALHLSRARATQATSITIGSLGSDVQIWQHIAKTPQAKALGLKISVKDVEDPVQLNKATAAGEIDVNAFQSWSYLQAFNQENPNTKLAALGTTYLEPMGLYSKVYQHVQDVKDGATVAIANNPANTTRALILLQSAGLIKLKPNFGALGGVNDIAKNPKHLKFQEIDDTTGPRVLHDVDLVAIGNTIALEGHLNVLTDSIFHEKLDQSTKDNVNVLATAAKNRNNAAYKKLVKLYHEKAIQQYVTKAFKGTKVEVNKPLSYFK